MTHILVDTANTFFWARHVIRGDTSEKVGMAIHIMMNSIKKAWQDFNGTHVVFCLEGRSWRKDHYAPYKRNRKETIDAMSDKELDDPDTIDGKARERIAAKAGKTMDDVTRMLFFYKQSLIICTWLQMKKKAGESLPSSEQELQEMQASDGRLGNIARKVMNPKGKKCGRGRRLPF